VRYRFEEIAVNSIAKKKPTERDKATYLGLEHLDSGNLTVTRFGSEVAPIGEKLLMKKGDVLFGKRRAYQKKVAIAPFDGIFSAHGMVLRPKEDVVDGRFFPLFISSDYFLDKAIKISVGSLSPTINWSALKELEFELPTLDKQRRLADILWAAIETRNAYKELLSLTEQLVKSQFVEMFGEPGSNPKGWMRTTIGESCHYVKDGPHVSPPYVEDGAGIPFISTRNLVNGDGIDWSTAKYISDADYEICAKKCKPEKGDMLYTKGGTTGVARYVKTDICFANWVHVAVLKFSDNLNGVFFENMLNSDYCYQQSQLLTKGIANKDLVLSAMKQIKFYLPPLDLQNRFAAFAEAADKSKFVTQRATKALDIRCIYKICSKQTLGGAENVL
jgi:type I restriction enzyme S subunit